MSDAQLGASLRYDPSHAADELAGIIRGMVEAAQGATWRWGRT